MSENSKNGHLRKCPYCSKILYTTPLLKSHISKYHSCYTCDNRIFSKDTHHCLGNQKGHGTDIDSGEFIEVAKSLRSTFRIYRLVVNEHYVSIEKLIRDKVHEITRLLEQLIIFHKGIKLRVVLLILMRENYSHAEPTNICSSKQYTLLHKSDIDRVLFHIVSDLITHVNIFVQNGSSWSIVQIEQINLEVSHLSLIRGRGLVGIPACYKKRYGIINPPTENKCFEYSIICEYLKIQDKKVGETLSVYQQFETFNDTEKLINFSCCDSNIGVSMEDITKFEKLNPTFSVNVFNHDSLEKDIYPLRITPSIKLNHANLMRINLTQENYHYIHLDFDMFMGKKHHRHKFYCYNCLHGFLTQKNLLEHRPVCLDFVKTKITFPKEDFVFHKLGKHAVFHSNYIVADFETLGNKLPTANKVQVPNQSCTTVEAVHEAITFSYVMIGDGNAEFYKMFSGIDCEVDFMKEMLMHAESYKIKSSAYSSVMRMTRDDWYVYMTSDICCICEEKLEGSDLTEEIIQNVQSGETEVISPIFTQATDQVCIEEGSELAMDRYTKGRTRTVRHHNHCGTSVYNDQARFIGSAHANCNLSLTSRRFLTVVFHGLSNFDSKYIISGASKLGLKKISVIAKTLEKYLCITIENKLRFICSLAHKPVALDSLVSDLRLEGVDKFKITRQVFYKLNPIELNDMLAKLPFCYEYCTHENLVVKSSSLPPRSVFFSSLKNEQVTIEEYERGERVYKLFGCSTLLDYLKVYNLLDCTLLGDIFETHRQQCKKLLKVDPLNFVSLSSMAFKAGMAKAKQRLEYVKSMDLFLLVKESYKGGICNLAWRHFKANIPGKKGYREDKPSSYIFQFDAISLYPFCMKSPLPIGNYKQLTEQEIMHFDPMLVDKDGPHGYILKVDIEIPLELHDYFRDLPLLPERVQIDKSQASEYQKEFFENESIPSNFNHDQYLTTLYNKTGYVLFIPMLQQAIKLGLILTRIHTIWRYDQAPFFNEVVDSYMTLRRNAKSEVEKKAAKDAINSSYGTFGIDQQKFKNIHLVTDHVSALNLIRQHNFGSFKIINEMLSIVEMNKTKACMRNNLIVASAILDRSKAYFYECIYTLKNHFKERIRNGYFDTDSVIFSVLTDDPYAELSQIQVRGEPLFDFSYLTPKSPFYDKYYSTVNKGIPGKFRSETSDTLITEFVGIKKKVYGCALDDNKPDKTRAKAIPKSAMKKVRIKTYRRTIFRKKIKRVKVRMLRSLNLQMCSILVHRIGFTPVCDSRFLLGKFGIASYPFGHKNIINSTHDTLYEEE